MQNAAFLSCLQRGAVPGARRAGRAPCRYFSVGAARHGLSAICVNELVTDPDLFGDYLATKHVAIVTTGCCAAN